MTTNAYPHSEWSPDIHRPQGPELGGDVYHYGRETRQLPVLQSREACEMASLEARRRGEEKDAAEAELAAMKERHKAAVKQQEARILTLKEQERQFLAVATSYYAPETVQVELRANARTGTMHFVRSDTGQQVDQRALYADEVQSVIPDLEDPTTWTRIHALMPHLPATAAELAAREDSSLSVDEATALLRAAQGRGLVSGDKGRTWSATDDGRVWWADPFDLDSKPLVVRAGATVSALQQYGGVLEEQRSELAAAHDQLEDETIDGSRVSADCRRVMEVLNASDGYTSRTRNIRHQLGDEWKMERVRTALDEAIERGYVSGVGGDRAKRTLTESGRDYILPF